MLLNLCRRIQERFFRIDPAVINLEPATDSSPIWRSLGALVAMAPLAGANPRIEVVSAPDPSLPVSVSAAGDSSPLGVTPDGSYVLFASTARNLVPGVSGGAGIDLYLACRTNGVVTLVSAPAPGMSGAHGTSSFGSITPNGRYVVFESADTDLCTNRVSAAGDVFVRDVQAGTTQLVSLNRQGRGGGNGASWSPVITPDGRFVAFVSIASDLVAGDENEIQDIFVRDLQQGTTVLVSQGAVLQPNSFLESASDSPVIIPDGRFVAFTSSDSNLVTSAQAVYQEVYIRDLAKGQTIWASQNFPTPSPLASYCPSLSDDGRYVVFESRGSAGFSVARYDLGTGSLEVIANNVAGHGRSAYDNYGPVMTPDGRFVAYSDDLSIHGSSSLWLVSINRFGTGSAHGASRSVSISANGRYAVFISAADDLTPNDTNGLEDVFVRDLPAGTTRLVSVSTNGVSANGASSYPAISADGRWVAFQSTATDLAPLGQPGSGFPVNVFARDMVAGTTRVTSPKSFVTVDAPVLAGPEGRFLAYRAVSLGGPYSDLYVTDLQTGAFLTLGSNVLAKAFSGDGRKVAYLELDVASQWNWLVVADLIQGTQIRLPLGSQREPSYAVLSANFDGRWVALSSLVPLAGPGTNAFRNLFLCDVPNANLVLVSLNRSGTGGGDGTSSLPQISADGRYVAFRSAARDLVAGDEHGLEFLFDRLTGQTTLLSPSTNAISGIPTSSLGLELTPDATRVVFSSFASDLVSGDFNGLVDIFTVGIEPTTPPSETPVIRLTEAIQRGGVTTIRWSATPGRSYRVEYQDTLAASGWQDLPGVVVIAGAEAWLADSSGSNAPQRFYRVRQFE